MVERIMELEPVIRLGFLFGMVALMGLWELAAPRRALTVGKGYRWLNNAAIPTEPTPTSGSISRSGTACWAPIGPSRGTATKA